MKENSESFKIELWNKISKSRGLRGVEYHACQDVFSECSDSYQKKIDELESLLKEACSLINGVTTRSNEIFNFLNKPEIKQILERGEE